MNGGRGGPVLALLGGCGCGWRGCVACGFGGGGGGRGPPLTDDGAGEGLAISGGNGGSGGGIDCGIGELTDCACGWRDTTGGSFAKTSLKIATKSSMFDFCSIC